MLKKSFGAILRTFHINFRRDQREIFRKMAVKSTIFELQQSFLHIFGVAQNFQFNGGCFMSQKGGGGRPPPLYPALQPLPIF